MYDHDIGLDWAQNIMAIARMTAKSKKLHEVEGPANIENLTAYCKNLKGTKRIVFEESTSSQWLYTELKGVVNEVVVANPRRNHYLKEGPKTDRIDAKKLVELLRAGLIKPVYHSGDTFIQLRKLLSGYLDVVQAGVRSKNQKAAIFRAFGKNCDDEIEDPTSRFVLKYLDKDIELYEKTKEEYLKEFEKLTKKHKVLRDLKSVPGLKTINALKVAAIVVDPRRFRTKSRFLAYCGLVKYEKLSGGRSYGKKRTEYNRILKNVFDTAAAACIQAGDNNFLKKDYIYLTTERRLPDYHARHAIARKAAILAWGVMKSGKRFDINKRRKDQALREEKKQRNRPIRPTFKTC